MCIPIAPISVLPPESEVGVRPRRRPPTRKSKWKMRIGSWRTAPRAPPPISRIAELDGRRPRRLANLTAGAHSDSPTIATATRRRSRQHHAPPFFFGPLRGANRIIAKCELNQVQTTIFPVPGGGEDFSDSGPAAAASPRDSRGIAWMEWIRIQF